MEKKSGGGKYSAWNQVGYIVEIPCSYPELTVRENLDIIRKLRGISDRKAVDHIIAGVTGTSLWWRYADHA